MPDGYTNPVVKGIMDGLAIRAHLERAAIQKAQLERAQQQMDWEDIQRRMDLEAVSRPVNEGRVFESLPVPGGITPGLDVSGISFDVNRAVRPADTVTYKPRRGQAFTRELLTEDERREKDIRESLLMNEAKTRGEIDRERLMRGELGQELPQFPGVKLMPKEWSTVMDDWLRQEGQNRRAADERSFRDKQGEITREHQRALKQMDHTAADVRLSRAEEGRSRRARMRGNTPKDPAPLNPITVTKTLDDIATDERALWTEHSELTSAVETGVYSDAKGNVYDLKAGTRTSPDGEEQKLSGNDILTRKTNLRRALAERKSAIAAKVKTKNDIIRKAGGTVGVSEQEIEKQLQGGGDPLGLFTGTGAAAGPPPDRAKGQAAGAPRQRAVNRKTGEVVEFDGQQWVSAPRNPYRSDSQLQGGGKGQLTDPAIAQQYLQKAGGDKAKARQLAQADGWTL